MTIIETAMLVHDEADAEVYRRKMADRGVQVEYTGEYGGVELSSPTMTEAEILRAMNEQDHADGTYAAGEWWGNDTAGHRPPWDDTPEP